MKRNGFTLAELCLVIMVLSLLTSLVWPSLKDFSRRWMAEGEMNRVVQKLLTARETAIARTQTQTLFMPDGHETFKTDTVVSFYSDGTAHEFQMDWSLSRGRCSSLRIERTGLIHVQEC